MMKMKKYGHLLILVLIQSACQGYGQTTKTPENEPGASEHSSELLYGLAICKQVNENMTKPELVVCPKGYKHCFTMAYVSKEGKLNILKQGCWRKSEAEEGQCVRKGCLFGQRPEVDIEDRRRCCCRGFACNRNSTYVDRILHVPKISTTQRTTSSEIPAKTQKTSKVKDMNPRETVILGVISSVFATFLVLSIVFVSWRCAAQKNKTLLSKKSRRTEKAVEEVIEYASISSEGISFGELLHKGKFSDIWKAEYDGKSVAIKIYRPESHAIWKNEKKTYDILGLHPNVTQFLAGVEIIGPCKAGKAVILSYYSCGSLLQYLTTNVLTWRTMYNLVFSLANGVAYIHGEIDEYDHFRRKVIVHRNLNHSNVLVKNDGTCALADFGTAVRVTGKLVLPVVQGGSVHYMAPEVMCDAVNWNDWESSLKQADVYSLGLIFWEIVRRCKDFYSDGETVSDTVLPYQSELGLNPSMSEMSQHVIKEKRRPVFPAALQVADKSDTLLKNTIEECWDVEPEARLTALCVVKRMQEVRNIKSIACTSDSENETFVEFSSSLSIAMNTCDRGTNSMEEVPMENIYIYKCSRGLEATCSCSSEHQNEISTKERLIHDDCEGCTNC